MGEQLKKSRPARKGANGRDFLVVTNADPAMHRDEIADVAALAAACLVFATVPAVMWTF
jgi:hypothetical protein